MTEMLHGMEDHGKESAAQDSFHASDNTTNATNATVKIEDKTLDPQSSEYNAAINKASVSAAAQLQDLTDRALRFLSHASNETLGACLIGLSATTYLVLGRVGLVLIGVVGGIALHATWEASGNSHGEGNMAKEKEANKRKELGLEVTQRVFAWREERNAEADEPTASPTQLVKPSTDKKLDFSGFQPETAAALNAFTDAIIRDYVKYAILNPPFIGMIIDTLQMVVRTRPPWRGLLPTRLSTDPCGFPTFLVISPIPQATSRCFSGLCDQLFLHRNRVLE